MKETERTRIPIRTALSMLGIYAGGKLAEQFRSVAFIIVYLVAFQTLVLSMPIHDAFSIALGIGLLIVGLSFFLEGLLLGLMPLGERVGIQLPTRVGLPFIILFSLLLGFGSTLAEPAIAALRTAGSSVTAWEAPLLYVLLTQQTDSLVVAVGIGVGIAVAAGMLRMYYGVDLKPFLFVVIPVLIAASTFASIDPVLSSIVGLAWDTGAVTTGAVTVPLVLAIGIGVSRASGEEEGASGGFGLIALASAFPVLAVLVLGAGLSAQIPSPTDEVEFFAPENREVALRVFADEGALVSHAFTHGSEEGRRALYDSEESYRSALDSRQTDPAETTARAVSQEEFGDVLTHESGMALRAVLPLTLLLVVVLVLVLRDRPRYTDEVFLGIVLAVFGMALLTTGIRFGLAPLGDEIGRQLPRAFESESAEVERIVVEQFDESVLNEAVRADGTRMRFFYLVQDSGVEEIVYDAGRHDRSASRYVHVIRRSPLFGPNLTILGISLVFAFAFGMGFGSTLAEPALNALGRTEEDLTVGTVRKNGVVYSVSIGVGVGLMAGVGRIMYDIPIGWLLLPPYALLLPLTYWSEESFAGIAWDSGGVTTGTVTVPLVLAMGLGIGGALDVVDGFGVLALASVFPILSVLIYGLIMSARQRRTIRDAEREEKE